MQSTTSTQKRMFRKFVGEKNLMFNKRLQILDELTLQARIEGLTDHFHRQIVGVSPNSMQVNISMVI